ncbi:MAG: hypothetical protein WBE14_15950 [Xanthobacteraceae bacterium]
MLETGVLQLALKILVDDDFLRDLGKTVMIGRGVPAGANKPTKGCATRSG